MRIKAKTQLKENGKEAIRFDFKHFLFMERDREMEG